MAQQITVRSRLIQSQITLVSTFSQGQGNGTVGPVLFHGAYNVFQHFLREAAVLSALEHKSPKSQFISLMTAFQYLVFCQPVSSGRTVASANAAVVTVVSAVIGKFNQSSGVNFIAVIFLLPVSGFFKKVFCGFGAAVRYQPNPFFFCEM